jgi:hypothetical protein
MMPPRDTTLTRLPLTRLLRFIALGLALSAASLALGWFDLRLASGLALLWTAAGCFTELIRRDGWAAGGTSTYAVAAFSLVVALTLPFISWYDLWLTTLVGFSATLSAVTAACMPYLDRRQVPDMMDEVPSDDASLAIPARPLKGGSQNLLILYSQMVMLGHFLVVWHTIHQHTVPQG